MLETILKGALIASGLIVAIGAQNAFVLKQGLARHHIFWVALICFLCDAVLMSAGVLGLGTLINTSTTATCSLALLGAAFLFWYGVKAFRSAYQATSYLEAASNANTASLAAVITTTLAMTLLNPHVYLDTVVILGSVAGTLPSHDKYWFLLGAVSVSGIWFFGLGYGARLLSPLFQKPQTWQALDLLIGIIMWTIAWGLLQADLCW
ncbi:L-lysine exporter family protein LysE/ArgO [Thiothrix caldifontis]|uniref:L-lysine exporter family protein LysE/ArgO n=1 Tax=Thiothrix caldifontis TaxID=525918 RepID=A0A1H3WMC8_9GAMM|nr:LysE/ArgO family amino acid transporter [Thiothrix caldifontis]SDZ87502.1 L-lysine exporter family protein LysE/ArgO [Thiothrix caldifontis]